MERFYLRTLLLVFVLIANSASAQPISLDGSFGNSGTVFQTYEGYLCAVVSMRTTSDGKLLIYAARDESEFFQSAGFILQRRSTDGSLDTSFGNNGVVLIEGIEHDGSSNKCLLLLSDGKIMVTGRGQNANFGNFVTYRFNADGSLDSSFGTNGVVVTDVGGVVDEAKAVLLQTAGNKIVVVGEFQDEVNPVRKPCVVRYLENGTLDSTFGVGGKAFFTTLPENSDNQITDVHVEANGKIVMVINHKTSNGDSDFCLARLAANGIVDTGFGNNGAQITDFGGDDRVNCIRKYDNTYYLFGSSATSDESSQIAISRYNSAGILIQAFGVNGKKLMNRAADSNYDVIYHVDIINEKIIAVGAGGTGTGDSFNLHGLIIQLNIDGSIDTFFNQTGYKLFNAPNTSYGSYYSITRGTSGSIFAAGTAYLQNDYSTGGILINRFLTSTLSVDVNSDSRFSISPNPFNDKIQIKSLTDSELPEMFELYDITGRLINASNIRTATNSEQSMIEVSGLDTLSSGIYVLIAKSNSGIQKFKILKK